MLGSEGTVLLRDLSYRTELVHEWGRTYGHLADDNTNQDRVSAWAADLYLEYLFRVPTHPRIDFEYLFASGDSDRFGTSTGTVGGNAVGTRDNAFNAFGYRDTGIAASPRLSNLHMLAAGARFFPLEKYRFFKKMELGTRVYFYMKNKSDSPTSDSTASNDARWLGWEWDVFCNWRFTSDLAWTMRYGVYQPGGAYPNGADESRDFLYTGITFSF